MDELQSITGSVYGVGSTHLMILRSAGKDNLIYICMILSYMLQIRISERDLFKNEFYRLAD